MCLPEGEDSLARLLGRDWTSSENSFDVRDSGRLVRTRASGLFAEGRCEPLGPA
jgi:hypothetical protein